MIKQPNIIFISLHIFRYTCLLFAFPVVRERIILNTANQASATYLAFNFFTLLYSKVANFKNINTAILIKILSAMRTDKRISFVMPIVCKISSNPISLEMHSQQNVNNALMVSKIKFGARLVILFKALNHIQFWECTSSYIPLNCYKQTFKCFRIS